MDQRTYLCIDLKSFYASVECADRGLDPFTDRLVVADPERGRGTICLAVSPALKALGVPGRCRVFDLPSGVDYVMARPRMRRYMEVSAAIYAIYLRFVSAQDVHVYSVDECFIDATPYLSLYGTDARGLARTLMRAVFDETGICAAAGIGSNLFLAKTALDVLAKHAPDNIACVDEAAFFRTLWFHRPITDIWGIGPRIARRLERHGVRELAGVAALPEEVLYREFGANAEYLIDHAWGQEPCTIAQIRAYVPQGHSLTNSQMLPRDYSAAEARIALREMVDAASLDLVEGGLVAERAGLFVGYSRRELGCGHTGGSRKLPARTNSARILWRHFAQLFDETTRADAPIRRIGIDLSDLQSEFMAPVGLFEAAEGLQRERAVQQAAVAVRGRFGKNALLKGTSLQDAALARERNGQVGGHHA